MNSDPKPARTYESLTPGQALDAWLNDDKTLETAWTDHWRKAEDGDFAVPAVILFNRKWRRVKEQGE